MREIGPSRTLRLLCLALLAITLLPLHKLERVQANASLINGSFESPGVSISTLVTAGSTFLTGWAVTQGSIEILPSQNWQASDGQFSLDLSGLEAGTIAQTLDTIAGRSYLVTFDLGGNPDHPEFGTIKQVQVSAANHSQIYTYDTINSPPLPAMIWARHAFQFVAIAASTTLEFRSLINTAFGPTLDNVSVMEFDICLQDDTNGSTLLINSVKGDYNFTRCGLGGFSLNGTGVVTLKGSIGTLQDYATDRRVIARFDNSIRRGTASVQLFSLGGVFTIVDRDMANNTCSCP